MWRSLRAYGALLLLMGMMTTSVLPASAATPTGWLHTKGSTIVDSTGAPHVIRAANWFGMETSGCAPHGLWQISLDEGLARIASMGFNTVRLPFSNECLAASTVNGIDQAKNPALVGLTPLQVMDAVVARSKLYGLSVILDRHRPDSAAQSALWYTSTWSEARWISDWTMLAKRYAKDPTVIGVDLHNEPRGDACWGCGDPKRDWAAAATRGGNAVLAVNPRLLVLVEGVEKQQAGPTTWWGGGLADARKRPVTLSVKNQLVYSTHEYPSSVFAQTWFRAKDYPANLPAVWRASWGYLQESGTAPVLIGEFGTKLESTSDRQWLTALVDYIRTNKMSFAYWSFNPNSGDTGGLVQDDWTTPRQAKLTLLRPILGTPRTVAPKPFPGPQPSPTPTPTGSPSPSGSPSAAGSPSPTGSPSPSGSPRPTPTASPTTTTSPSTTTSPTTTARPTTTPSTSPSPTQSPTQRPTPRPTATGATPTPSGSPTATGSAATTRAVWQLQSSWQAGYVANLTVTSTQPRQGWTVRWSDPSATSVMSSWGMRCAVASGTITCTGSEFGATLVPGTPVQAGLQVVTKGAAPVSPRLTVS